MDNIILDLTQLSDFDLETYLLERIKEHTQLLTKKQMVDATYREQQKQTDMAYAAYEAELRHLRQLGDHCESALENVIDMGNMVKAAYFEQVRREQSDDTKEVRLPATTG